MPITAPVLSAVAWRSCALTAAVCTVLASGAWGGTGGLPAIGADAAPNASPPAPNAKPPARAPSVTAGMLPLQPLVVRLPSDAPRATAAAGPAAPDNQHLLMLMLLGRVASGGGGPFGQLGQ